MVVNSFLPLVQAFFQPGDCPVAFLWIGGEFRICSTNQQQMEFGEILSDP